MIAFSKQINKDDWLMGEVITSINDFLWTYILLVALLGCGVWFTWRTRFVQFRMVVEMIRLLGDSAKKFDHSKRHISSFQAFTVSLASRVGTGNLAGVATAIAFGGPGAVFWMWVIALFGAATAFVESTLAQLYKRPHTDSFIGGPAYYISKGMHNRWMAALFAVLITITFALSNNSVQSNTICSAMETAFGMNPTIVGIALSIITLFVVFGGIQRVAKVSSIVVPIMAVGYLIISIVVVIMNINLVPHVLRVIVENAFGIVPVTGGGLGMTIIYGVKRGLFSNEAGEGSAPNAAATAAVTHPVKQGLIQALGVFTDTLLVCSCTAFIILISGLYEVEGLNGIALTQNALESEIGSSGPVFIAVAIFLFAYSSIIGNYYYGEANVRYLSNKRWVLIIFRLLSGGVMVMFGAMATLETVWNIVDICMALLTACNLVAIVTLGKYAFRLLDDYIKQKREGNKSPEFHRSAMPDIADDIECWE